MEAGAWQCPISICGRRLASGAATLLFRIRQLRVIGQIGDGEPPSATVICSLFPSSGISITCPKVFVQFTLTKPPDSVKVPQNSIFFLQWGGDLQWSQTTERQIREALIFGRFRFKNGFKSGIFCSKAFQIWDKIVGFFTLLATNFLALQPPPPVCLTFMNGPLSTAVEQVPSAPLGPSPRTSSSRSTSSPNCATAGTSRPDRGEGGGGMGRKNGENSPSPEASPRGASFPSEHLSVPIF